MEVNIVIYDVMGREIKTLVSGIQDPGYKSITWNSTNSFGEQVSTGVCFYVISSVKIKSLENASNEVKLAPQDHAICHTIIILCQLLILNVKTEYQTGISILQRGR